MAEILSPRPFSDFPLFASGFVEQLRLFRQVGALLESDLRSADGGVKVQRSAE
jgi:hypothetical protein